MATNILIALIFLLSTSPSPSSSSADLSFSLPLVRRLRSHPQLLRSKTPNSITSLVLPNTADHLMQFSIGTPPVKVLAVIDTGSDLIWSRCKPCSDCAGRAVPVFDPSLSKTYTTLPCKSTLCRALDPAACSESPDCTYTYGYGDGTYTDGVLGMETLTFDTVNGAPVSIPNIGFGCGHDNSVSFDGRPIGIVGLGGRPTSLVSQLGPSIGWKFSYCLVPFHEKTASSHMNFGDNAIVAGHNAVWTPMVAKEDPTYYYLTLESITVGGRRINALASSSDTGNVFIDSGTTVTMLNKRVFGELADAVEAVVRRPRTMDPEGTFVCFKATSWDGFPDVTFGFSGGADLVVGPAGAFTEPSPDGLVCLAMQATEGTGVFDNLVQQNFHVGFDLVKKVVSFAPTECSKMTG